MATATAGSASLSSDSPVVIFDQSVDGEAYRAMRLANRAASSGYVKARYWILEAGSLIQVPKGSDRIELAAGCETLLAGRGQNSSIAKIEVTRESGVAVTVEFGPTVV